MMDILLAALILATSGAFLQIGGTSWDVTYHLLQRPESFFTPSHAVLYAGVGMLTIAAGIGGILLLRNKELRTKSFASAFKLLIIGSGIALVAGPADFWWHQIFGVDGLLSPTHLTLATGMLINSVAVVFGLARINVHFLSKSKKLMIKGALIPAFAAMWLTLIWYVHMFALPLSNGQHFNFNLDPITATIIAIVALPLICSVVFLTASKTIGGVGGDGGKFGAASAVAILLIGMNVFASIVPSYRAVSFLPWYALIVYPTVIIADLILNTSLPKKSSEQSKMIIAGAVIGSAFYMIDFPWINLTFTHLLLPTHTFITDHIANTIPYFLITLPITSVMTIIPGAIIGALSSSIFFLYKRKRVQRQNETMPSQL
ncbi:MAG: hypothetical protein DLM72_08940 [Candidatus Nitrosopolaris wilkensis]|nr:MAG: hypothetical protein DLM72_08940 [Candidatus Nitrosopolaris wilkensis]